jgi:hypothetical protein
MPDLPPKYDPTGVSHQSAEETNDPLIADNRNFYKVEKWTKDGAKVGRQPRQGAGGLRGGDQASAPYTAYNSAAEPSVGAVAGTTPIGRGTGRSWVTTSWSSGDRANHVRLTSSKSIFSKRVSSVFK